MTVTAVGFSGPTWVQSPGNGAATVFSFPFLITAATDLVVGFIAGGTYSIQAGGFTVSASSIGNSGGGQITFAVAPPLGTTVDIRSYIPETQPTNFSNLGGYYPENTTNAVDRLTRLVTDLYRLTYQFGIHGPDQENIPWPALPGPAARAGSGLVFDPSTGLPTIGVLTATPLTQSTFNAFLSTSNVLSISDVGNILNYGADPTGANDSTAAINAALAAHSLVHAPAGTYACSGPLNMSSAQTLYGDGVGTVLLYSNPSVNAIVMNGVVGAKARDVSVLYTGTNAIAESAGVYMFGCSYCQVEHVSVSGHNFAGVWLDGAANNNVIFNNSFTHAQDPQGAGADIFVYSIHGSGINSPSRNIIYGNQCQGGGGYGIALLDPYAAGINGFPVFNVIYGNKVGAHLTYGILVYLPGSSAPATNTFNDVIGNSVENVSGTGVTGGSPTNSASGAGIYAVGVGIGGLKVVANTVSNCCIGTLVRTLAPAGIGIAGVQTGIVRPVVADNIIANMTQGDCILITSSPGGAVVTGNSGTSPSTNNGTGPGGASLAGAGLRIEASSNVTVGPNNMEMYGTGTCLFIYANGTNCNMITLDGGQYTVNFTGTGQAFACAQQGGFNIQQFQATGVRFTAAAGTNDAVNVNAIVVGTLTNCVGNATGGRGFFLNGCTNTKVAGGAYSTVSGSAAIATSGVCTGSYFSKDIFFFGPIVNAGTGVNIEYRASAFPVTGTFAVGDHIEQSVPVVGQPIGWYCTTAGGSGGTWHAEANL